MKPLTKCWCTPWFHLIDGIFYHSICSVSLGEQFHGLCSQNDWFYSIGKQVSVIFLRKIPYLTCLPMCPDNRAEKFPGASPPVNSHHTQDLEESESSQGRGCKHLSTATKAQDHNTGADHNDIWNTQVRSCQGQWATDVECHSHHTRMDQHWLGLPYHQWVLISLYTKLNLKAMKYGICAHMDFKKYIKGTTGCI